jgi:hypothetical protein
MPYAIPFDEFRSVVFFSDDWLNMFVYRKGKHLFVGHDPKIHSIHNKRYFTLSRPSTTFAILPLAEILRPHQHLAELKQTKYCFVYYKGIRI